MMRIFFTVLLKMWPALEKLTDLKYGVATRKRTASDGKFHSLEMNSYGKGKSSHTRDSK